MNTRVTRYEICYEFDPSTGEHTTDLMPCPDGSYVSYEDFLSLFQEFKTLQDELKCR